MSPYAEQIVQRARYLEAIDASRGHELNPLGWRLLDLGYEVTMREAEAEGAECYEAVLTALFREASTVAIIKALGRDPHA